MDSNTRAGGGAELTAIDVLLEPDATMVSRAEAANARLRENVSTGYALDALHAPHITVLQRHVRTRDLASMYPAVQRVFETEHLAELQMKATGYYYIPFTEKGMSMGLAGIVIEPSAALLRLQQKLIDAVAPFSESGGTAAAYITAPENAHLLNQLIEYVDSYVPKQTGKNYNPHVTVGVGREEFLKRLKAEPFDCRRDSRARVHFSPVGRVHDRKHSKRVELLDHARLRAQLLALERRTARGGRDSIDQGRGRALGTTSSTPQRSRCGLLLRLQAPDTT